MLMRCCEVINSSNSRKSWSEMHTQFTHFRQYHSVHYAPQVRNFDSKKQHGHILIAILCRDAEVHEIHHFTA